MQHDVSLSADFLTIYQVNGLFFAIGHEPASKFLDGQIALDADGYIKTEPGTTTTNIPGKMKRCQALVLNSSCYSMWTD